MKKIPDTIQIGAHIFKITLKEGIVYKDDYFGHWDMVDKTIVIEKNISLLEQIETLIHECIEITYSFNGLKFKHSDVFMISHGLTQALFGGIKPPITSAVVRRKPINVGII